MLPAQGPADSSFLHFCRLVAFSFRRPRGPLIHPSFFLQRDVGAENPLSGPHAYRHSRPSAGSPQVCCGCCGCCGPTGQGLQASLLKLFQDPFIRLFQARTHVCFSENHACSSTSRVVPAQGQKEGFWPALAPKQIEESQSALGITHPGPDS